MKIPPALKVKMAGLPRWAWLALLAGGVGVGLYLHAANTAETEGEGEEESEELPAGSPQSLEGYEGTETGGGLQALGVAGPTPQATVPVESPVVPEGVTQTVEGQQDTIQSLANGVIESNLASSELARSLAERPAPEAPEAPEGSKEIIREKMVGHAPKRKVHHKPPRTKPKPKKPAKKVHHAVKQAKHKAKPKHKNKRR